MMTTTTERRKPLTAPTAKGSREITDALTLPDSDTAVNSLLALLGHLHSSRTRTLALLLSSRDELAELPSMAIQNLSYAENRRQRRERRLVLLNGQINAVKLALSALTSQEEVRW